jgi:adenylate cyclase, class 2
MSEILEVEIKVWCENHQEVIDLIIKLGGQKYVDLKEVDMYFNHPSRDFAQTDEAFRLRKQNNKNKITYKGPKISKKAKTRYEAETEFDNFDKMKTILEKLSFRKSGIVEKNRTIYKLNNIDICIDSVNNVGTFVELEKMGTNKEQIETELFEMAKKLNLSKFETKSYLELMFESENNKKL